MTKKTEEKKRFPKPTGRIGKKPLIETLKPVLDNDTVTDVEPEAPTPVEGEVLPPVDKWIKITVDPKKGSHIDIHDLNAVEVLTILKGAHKYIFTQLQKELGQVDGTEEGTADATSRGNS